MKLSKASGWFGMAALAAAGALSGCGIGTTASSDAHTFSDAGAMAGVIHGGQQPVEYATVKLFAAGTSAYGTGSTLLATYNGPTGTGTDKTGSFSFTNTGTTGPSDNTTSTYSCPASGDPMIYIMAIGGNSQTSGAADSDRNTAITLLAALGPCSTVTSGTYVVLDELSTAAAAFALSAYINPGTTAGTETIGTSATAQGTVGLNNAVAGIANLTAVSKSYSGATSTSTSVAGVTVTATAEAGKMNQIANILASCVNTPTQTSTNCQQLFAGATPKTGTTAPVDILQAAYNMATNPTQLGTPTGACAGQASNIACLAGLAPGTGAPFQTAAATTPTDWTIGVTYSATGTCTNNGLAGALFFDSPTKEAVDANGNIYIINGSQFKASMVEISPVGAPLACVLTPLATGSSMLQTYGAGITIDPSGNVWGLYSHGTTTNAIVEWTPGSTTATPYASSLAAQPYALGTDIDGNIFYTTAATGGSLYEFVVPAGGAINLASVSPVKAVTQLYAGGGTYTANAIVGDTTGRVTVNSASIASLVANWPLTSAITAVTASGGTITFTGSNSFAAGLTVTVSGLTGAGVTQFNGQRFLLTAATSTSFTAATAGAGTSTSEAAASARATGLSSGGTSGYQPSYFGEASSGYGLALDSSNHYYSGTACCTNGSTGWGVLSKITPLATYVAEATGTDSSRVITAQYVGGLNGTRSVALDGAGRAWMGSYWWETTVNSTNVYGIQAINASGSTAASLTAFSPTGTGTCAGTAGGGCAVNGGFQKADLVATTDIAVDPSGNVWAVGTGPNTGATATGVVSPNCPVSNTTSCSGANAQPLGVKVVELVGAATPTVTPLITATIKGTLATAP